MENRKVQKLRMVSTKSNKNPEKTTLRETALRLITNHGWMLFLQYRFKCFLEYSRLEYLENPYFFILRKFQ